jgi:hypothetical protein
MCKCDEYLGAFQIVTLISFYYLSLTHKDFHKGRPEIH